VCVRGEEKGGERVHVREYVSVCERERVCVCGTGHRDPLGAGDVCLRGEER